MKIDNKSDLIPEKQPFTLSNQVSKKNNCLIFNNILLILS